MADIWFISDTHFLQKNILTFERDDGSMLREFYDIHHMNEYIIDRWNSVVKPQDKVYHLGDVYMGNKQEADVILSRLNGKKRLMVGNHDRLEDKVLVNHFQKISLWNIFNICGIKIIASHVPLRKDQMLGDLNVHGHIHYRKMKEPWYKNVSVESVDYTPVHIEELAR